MTDKQFVKSVCPTAHLRNTLKKKTVFWYIDIRPKAGIYSPKFTASPISGEFIIKGDAWKDAAEKLRMDIMTDEAVIAKKFVLAIHPGAYFVPREDTPDGYAFTPTPDDCQIMDGDGRHSLARKWSYNENDAWIDAKNLINTKMMQKLES